MLFSAIDTPWTSLGVYVDRKIGSWLYREGALHASLSYSLVLSKAFPSFLSLLQPAFLKNFFNLHVLDSLYGRCSKYFMTERMRRAFSFGSMYLGSSPFDSPGTYTWVRWMRLEQTDNVDYYSGPKYARVSYVPLGNHWVQKLTGSGTPKADSIQYPTP
jgi:hypothetical protein